MENSRRCDISICNFHRSSFTKHLRSIKHFEIMKQDDMIKPDQLFQKLIENLSNIPRRIYYSKPLREIARGKIFIDDKQLKQIG